MASPLVDYYSAGFQKKHTPYIRPKPPRFPPQEFLRPPCETFIRRTRRAHHAPTIPTYGLPALEARNSCGRLAKPLFVARAARTTLQHSLHAASQLSRPGTPAAALRNLYSSHEPRTSRSSTPYTRPPCSRGQELLRPPCETFIRRTCRAHHAPTLPTYGLPGLEARNSCGRLAKPLFVARAAHTTLQHSLHTASQVSRPGAPAAALRNLYSHAPLCLELGPLYLYLNTFFLLLPTPTSKCRNLYIQPPISQPRNSCGRLAKPFFGARRGRVHSSLPPLLSRLLTPMPTPHFHSSQARHSYGRPIPFPLPLPLPLPLLPKCRNLYIRPPTCTSTSTRTSTSVSTSFSTSTLTPIPTPPSSLLATYTLCA